ncbi:hypothetical protein [Polaromonas sp.]|uniref:hypothetical protein n=1 Tax=Polaromonas sp. TaxID=1869339 RepID=UPI003C85084F
MRLLQDACVRPLNQLCLRGKAAQARKSRAENKSRKRQAGARQNEFMVNICQSQQIVLTIYSVFSQRSERCMNENDLFMQHQTTNMRFFSRPASAKSPGYGNRQKHCDVTRATFQPAFANFVGRCNASPSSAYFRQCHLTRRQTTEIALPPSKKKNRCAVFA